MPATNPARKRGPGRPPMDEPTVNLNFRVPVADAEFVAAEAEALGQTQSEWLRRLVARCRKSIEAGRSAKQRQ